MRGTFQLLNGMECLVICFVSKPAWTTAQFPGRNSRFCPRHNLTTVRKPEPDPANKGALSDQERTTKMLQVTREPDVGWYFHMKTRTGEDDEENVIEVSVPLPAAEFEVFKVNARFLIPYFCGLNKTF